MTELNNRLIPLTWAIRTRVEPLSLSKDIEGALRTASGGLPAGEIRSMDQVLISSTARSNFSMSVLTIFASIALFLASVGIYSLLAHSVQNRTQEIGLRMALGASSGDLRRMVMLEGIRLTAIGVMIGEGTAFGLTRFLSAQLYSIPARDPLAFSAVPFLFLAVVAVATYLPARRATRIDPLAALRCE